MYTYDVSLAAVLDLRGASARANVQLSDRDLRADDATKCQQIGESVRYLGLEGILAPPATGEGTVLAVFFDSMRADSQIHDLDYEPWTAAPRGS